MVVTNKQKFNMKYKQPKNQANCMKMIKQELHMRCYKSNARLPYTNAVCLHLISCLLHSFSYLQLRPITRK